MDSHFDEDNHDFLIEDIFMNTGPLDNLGKMYYWYVCSNPQDTVIQHDEMEYLSGFYVSGDIELNWELIWKGFLKSLFENGFWFRFRFYLKGILYSLVQLLPRPARL